MSSKLHNTLKLDISAIMEEYAPQSLKDNEEIYKLKCIIFNELSEAEKRIILLYADEGSTYKVAKHLNCSAMMVYNYLKSIKQKIYDSYNKIS